jgi:hypothetical protein
VTAGATPADIQRRIATEFERNGWEYDLTIGTDLVAAIDRAGGVDGRSLAQRVPTDFLVRNTATREAVADAIERAVGGASIGRAVEAAKTVVINDSRYSINLGPGAEIEGSTINVAGTQINVSVNVEKTEVLAAAEALIRAGLSGNWNPSAARDLAAVIDQRSDVTVDEIRELTAEIATATKPTPDRVRDFLTQVAANAIGGALSVGISAGLAFFL